MLSSTFRYAVKHIFAICQLTLAERSTNQVPRDVPSFLEGLEHLVAFKALSDELQLVRSMFAAGGGVTLAFEWSLCVSCTILRSNYTSGNLCGSLHECAPDATVVAPCEV